MYSDKILDFFKKHNLYEKEMFDYLQSHTDMIDYQIEEERDFIGCAYAINHYTKRLDRFRMGLPYVYDDITALINIHEIVHGIEGYKHLNKKFTPGMTCEALPLVYEKIYIAENPSKELIAYWNYLNSRIKEDSDIQYRFGLSVRDELFSKYVDDYKKMNKMVNKLARKYNRENRNK